MIKKKQREYASVQEYITPFLKRYRRVFWFDAFLAFLHIPLLAYLLIEKPILIEDPIFDFKVVVGWKTSLIHLSLAGFGLVANALLLKDVSFSAIVAYLKIIYTITIRGLVFLILAYSIGISFFEIISPIYFLVLMFILYQGFYGSCVHLYSKWKRELDTVSDKQKFEPTSLNAGDEFNAQGEVAHF